MLEAFHRDATEQLIVTLEIFLSPPCNRIKINDESKTRRLSVLEGLQTALHPKESQTLVYAPGIN